MTDIYKQRNFIFYIAAINFHIQLSQIVTLQNLIENPL